MLCLFNRTTRYTVVINNQYNASYTFTDPLYLSSKTHQYNCYDYLNTHIDYICSVLGFTKSDKTKMNALIMLSKGELKKDEAYLPIEFLDGYDEVGLTITNKKGAFSSTLYIVRLL